MTLSTKPELHNVYDISVYRRQPSHGHCQHALKYLAKFGRVVLELRKRTDRQTDILIAILRVPPDHGEVKKNVIKKLSILSRHL